MDVINKTLEDMWNKSVANERQKFVDLARDETRRMEEAGIEFDAFGIKEQPRKKRPKKDPNAPKRNMSAYLFFSNIRRRDVQDKHPELNFTEIAKVLSKMWAEASPEDKAEFEEMAEADKKRYFNQKKAYNDMCKDRAMMTGSQSLPVGGVTIQPAQQHNYGTVSMINPHTSSITGSPAQHNYDVGQGSIKGLGRGRDELASGIIAFSS
eukprot:CAMPEP_0168535010 /NCGR_PEP_ID=MMETSP0405-20121227/18367_1 /TAXON_ID=498012 /ORGANISM="Trichosphaerium sp, Strain Am-I-7 wt" /LENGTH=208 /DNA_ID=CAMNT_0008562079 /DNA_START=377 /DNA_END=1003 /DNA_ORIENTATION=+